MSDFNVRPAITQLLRSFFEGMTEEQWVSLKTCRPDDTAMTMMGELMLDIVATVLKNFMKSLGSTTAVSEEDVKTHLGDTIGECFAEALGVDASVSCPSLQSLTSLISQEVSDSVQSALSSPEGVIQRFTPPSKLNSMILDACKVFQALIGMMPTVFSARPRKHRASLSSVKELVLEDIESYEEDVSSDVSSDVVTEMKKTNSIEDIIRHELNDITQRLLVDVPDSEYTLLQSQNSREIEDVAEDITRTIAEDAVDPTPSGQRSKRSKKSIWSKIKKLLGKCFAKAWFHRIVAQITKSFHRGKKVPSQESVNALMKKFNSLLKKQETRKLLGLASPGLNIPADRVLVFTNLLSELLYTHIADGPEIIPEPVIRANILADLRRKVLNFLSLARWWQIFQAGDLADKVKDAIMAAEFRANKPVAIAAPPRQVNMTISREDFARQARDKQNKLYVEVLMERLVSRIFKKAKVSWSLSNVKDLIEGLLERTWAELEGIDFDCDPATFENLEKTICRDLCKKWCNISCVMMSLKTDDPGLGDYIARAVKGHLKTPQRECCCMCRFFTSMFNTVTRR